MKKIITILAFWLIINGQWSMVNGQTMKQLFTTLPDTILPSLSKNDRLDMVDFIENNMKNEVTNRLRGKSVLQSRLDTCNLSIVDI